MSDLVLGFFFGSKTKKQAKGAITSKLKEIKSCLLVPGICMRKQKLFPVLRVSFGLLKSDCSQI